MAPSRGGKDTTKASRSAKTTAQKKQTARKTQDEPSPPTQGRPAIVTAPLKVQQSLLDVFSSTFPHLLGLQAAQDTLKPLLQEVKGHLYKRDFAAAFGKEEYLEAYAARWSASRALGYLHIFHEVLQHFGAIDEDVMGEELIPDNQRGKQSREHDLEIICLGGGAGAELVALAGLLKLSESHSGLGIPNVAGAAAEDTIDSTDTNNPPSNRRLASTLVDVADWSNVTAALTKAVFEQPKVSPYASAAVKAAAKPLVSSASAFSSRFYKQDVLEADFDISSLLTSTTSSSMIEENQRTPKSTKKLLITLMFTLNELYATSIAATQHFLINLTLAAEPGTLLLVVDSPGSYSTVTINNSEKKYPLLWLLEHTLLNRAPKALDPGREDASEPVVWERVLSDESRWFRLPEGLRYPIELENMRYQIHLYRRIKAT